MSIGETLAGARNWAGLTIADVSARSRIRAELIRAIEQDDFSAYGDDLFARGHIRTIAAVVGTDPDAMIRQYDAAHSPAPPAPPVHPEGPEDAEDEPGRPPARHRPAQVAGLAVAAVALLAVIGFAADKVITGTVDAHQPTAAPSAARAVTAQSARPAANPEGSGRPSAPPSFTAAPARATSAKATPTRATRAPATPTRATPTGATPARTAPASAAVVSTAPVSAKPFGPTGTSDGDNPQDAPLALSGAAGKSWHTDWYSTPTFGGLKTGTGLLLDLGRTDAITGVAVRLGNTPGAALQLRTGTTPASLATVAGASGAGGLVRLRLSAPVNGRYLLIWFTRLPPNGNGSYEAFVSGVTATVTR
ncbi:MAG TPA: helix-turn-helix domain-containing protein [Trebonia sp.]